MIRTGLVAMVGCLAGCANFEPYHRTDVWYPSGSNAGNIAAMAVDPADLIHGRGGKAGDAPQAAGAIDRIWEGHPKPLGSTGGTSSAAGGAPAGAAAGPGAQSQ
jgi:hypothetical protein